jgi:hypothetical protein
MGRPDSLPNKRRPDSPTYNVTEAWLPYFFLIPDSIT